MRRFNLLILLTLFPSILLGQETCSRAAIVNHQEILVDTNSSTKGEGLRYYLEKDPESLQLLEKYQDGTRVKFLNAALGTTSSGLLIAGLLTNKDSKKRQTLIISGAALLLVNFLYSKTLERSNEVYLQKAIDTYNKRNLPRIYFNIDQQDGVETDYQVMLNKGWKF